MNADRDRSEAPVGPPLHEQADRDGDNVPNATPAQIKAAQDVLGCYRDLCIHGAMADGVCPRARNVANRVVAADREQAALRARVARVEALADAWEQEHAKYPGDSLGFDYAARVLRRRLHDPGFSTDTVAENLAALRGPAPTEERAAALAEAIRTDNEQVRADDFQKWLNRPQPTEEPS